MLRPVVDPEQTGQAVATKPLLCAVLVPEIPASSTSTCLNDSHVSLVSPHPGLP